jgi:hypothetical protein
MGAKRLDSLEGSGREWEEEKEWRRRIGSIEERIGGRLSRGVRGTGGWGVN